MELVNRKSRYDYEYIEVFTAGIKLIGPEVKSVISGEISMDGSFCLLTTNGLIIKNLYIKEYKFGDNQSFSHKQDPMRDKILLLNKSELSRINRLMINQGYTLIPTKIFQNERGLIKVNIAVAKGKKLWNKREDIKKRDIEKELNRIM